MKSLTIVLVLSLIGCVNPYTKFYRATADAQTMPGYVASSEPLKIYTTND